MSRNNRKNRGKKPKGSVGGSHSRKQQHQKKPSRPGGRGRPGAPKGANPWSSQGKRGQGPQRTLTLQATVDKNAKGFAHLVFDSKDLEDVFVPPREAERFFPNDRVTVTFRPNGEVLSIQLLEHRYRELVGRFTLTTSERGRNAPNGGVVIFERKKIREEVFVPFWPGDPMTAKEGDWVRIKLNFHERGRHQVTGELLEVFGPELPARADIQMIAGEFNLAEEHSAEANALAASFKLEVPGKDMEGRVDLREVPFITIDGETARDFDDAVFVERHKSGYLLWVAIADVSHYVKEKSIIDIDAYKRATSVYFPERAFHMLPRPLSENLCSLRPNEPRLAMVAKMVFDRNGVRESTEVMNAVIFSRRRATYTEIFAEYEAKGKDKNWEYRPHFELYKLIRSQRSKRGSIDFELPEPYVEVDPEGNPTAIETRSRNDAHKLIEDFMIAANEAVTEWVMEKNWPFIFRTHDRPSAQALENFAKLAKTAGVHVDLHAAIESPAILADLVREFEKNPASFLLNTMLLRSMKQAVYTAEHGIHYGLASEGYTHFTSPIRRYPDLIVHRILKQILKNPGDRAARSHYEEKLPEMAQHCSFRERLATQAERESHKLKAARLMMKELGNVFPARIVGMTERGMFAQIASPYVEGFIAQDKMDDDFYQFNEDRMIFYGKRKKKTFKVGQDVTIQVVSVNLEKRMIDFVLTEEDGQNSPD